MRKNSSFGISIKGGDRGTQDSARPIFISKCDRRHSNINIGDRIIACNDKSMLNASHKEAVEAIQRYFDFGNQGREIFPEIINLLISVPEINCVCN